MKIKAVLFDMDGLIFDTEGICKTSWQNAVSEQGLVLTDDYYQRFIGTQDVQCEQLLVDAFGERLDMARFRLVRDTMLEAERKKGVKFKAGFEDIFSELKGRSLQCALVTSSALPQVEHHFAGSDYLQYFNTIITAEKVENGKPARIVTVWLVSSWISTRFIVLCWKILTMVCVQGWMLAAMR